MQNVPLTNDQLAVELQKQFPEIIKRYLNGRSENKFHVFTQQRGSTALVNVYSGESAEQSMKTANFWDERMNTYHLRTSQIVAFIQKRLANMTIEERIQEDVNAALARIHEMTDKLNAK